MRSNRLVTRGKLRRVDIMSYRAVGRSVIAAPVMMKGRKVMGSRDILL
jgi:hypothetical protein